MILGFGAMMVDGKWLDSGGVELLGAIGRSYAARSTVDVALIFNEAHTLDQALRAIDAGFNTVMIDTHSWPIEAAIAAVKELCRVAHQSGVAVEGELGSPAEATASGVDHSHATPHGSRRSRALRGGDRHRLPGSFSRECPHHDGRGVDDRHGASAIDPRASGRAAGHPRRDELSRGRRCAGDRARGREVQRRDGAQARLLGRPRSRCPLRRAHRPTCTSCSAPTRTQMSCTSPRRG